MPGVAAERTAQQRQRLILRHAAAGLVGQRHHAVDIGEIRQRIVVGERILLEDVGDHARDMRAAIHRGEDADIVAGRDPPVGTDNALEGRGQIEIRRRRDIDAERIVLGEIAHAAILGMDMLARRDGHGRKADDLAVAPDRLARPRWAGSPLYARPESARSWSRPPPPPCRPAGSSAQSARHRRGAGESRGLGSWDVSLALSPLPSFTESRPPRRPFLNGTPKQRFGYVALCDPVRGRAQRQSLPSHSRRSPHPNPLRTSYARLDPRSAGRGRSELRLAAEVLAGLRGLHPGVGRHQAAFVGQRHQHEAHVDRATAPSAPLQ